MKRARLFFALSGATLAMTATVAAVPPAPAAPAERSNAAIPAQLARVIKPCVFHLHEDGVWYTLNDHHVLRVSTPPGG